MSEENKIDIPNAHQNESASMSVAATLLELDSTQVKKVEHQDQHNLFEWINESIPQIGETDRIFRKSHHKEYLENHPDYWSMKNWVQTC